MRLGTPCIKFSQRGQGVNDIFSLFHEILSLSLTWIQRGQGVKSFFTFNTNTITSSVAIQLSDMKLVNISMVGDLTNALKENADFQRHDTFKEESVGQLPLISITKPEEWHVVVLILVVYLVFDLTWLFCMISEKKPTEQTMEDQENCKESKKWERSKVISIHQVGTQNN